MLNSALFQGFLTESDAAAAMSADWWADLLALF
jgi:hypothetical protein